MPSEQFEHIQRIRQTYLHDSEASKTNQNNAIELLADDLYKKHTHFIFELIQNAEDNTYEECAPYPPYISFRLTKTDPIGIPGSDGALIIQNNEFGFTCHNVDAICAVGRTTKKKAQGYIGEKGIGFKSVFRVTENPHIFSNGYHFCLPKRDEQIGLGYIVPQWIDTLPEGLDFSQTLIILPLTKADFGYDKIKEMLRDIEPEVILFLSKLKEIRIETDTGADWTILKDDDARPEVAVVVEGSKQGLAFSDSDDFLVCTRTFDKPADISHEKREKIESRDVSIAFPLNENSRSLGKVFAYLPIRSDMNFPFLINADFILTSSREEIQEEDWNRWLIDCVADLVVAEFLPLLKERELLSLSFLEALAGWLNNLAEDRNNLFYPIFSRVNEALKNEKFLPANDGTFVSASNAKLARGDAIRSLLSDEQLICLFGSSHEIKWLSGEITLNRTRELRSLLMELNVAEVRPPFFVSRLSEQFLEQQSDEWFIRFYRFLSTHFGDLRYDLPIKKPILRLQNGTHVKPSPGEDTAPNAYLPIGIDTDSSFPIVKVGLTQDEDVRKFLRNELEVPEWDIVEEVIEYILPKYECDCRTVSVANHQNDFEKIEHAYNTDSHTKKTRLRGKLLSTRFIVAKHSSLSGPMYLKPDQLYLKSDELRLYFDENESCNFVNLDEYPPSARELFNELSIMDTVRVNKEEPNYEGHVVIRKDRGDHARGLDGFDPSIEVDGLEHAINHPNPKKSEFIWNLIAKPNSNCIRGIVEKSTNQFYRDSEQEERTSYDFGRLLIESAWLPGSAGQMHRPCELTLDDLPESFVRDANLAEKLGLKKDEVAELAEKTGIPLKVIEVLKKPGMSERFEEFLAREGTVQVNPTSPISSNPAFPESPVKNPERRAAMLDKELENLPAKEYERLLRSVRVNLAREAARVRFKSEYTNDDEQMICQICQKEMPFKKHDGEYYFEAVEALNKENFTKELEAQFLALCPECAARYQEFIKRDEDAMQAIIDRLMASTDFQVQLQLGELNTNLRFVEKHWRDIKQILESA